MTRRPLRNPSPAFKAKVAPAAMSDTIDVHADVIETRRDLPSRFRMMKTTDLL